MSQQLNGDSLLDEITARIPEAEFQAEYFPDGMAEVTMQLAADMLEEIKALAGERGWSGADAAAFALGYGIGCMKEAQARQLLERNDQAARDEIDLMLRDMREMHAQYAVMKHRTWTFLQAFQAASLSSGALVNQVAGLKSVVTRLRAENDDLRQEIVRLQAMLDEVQPAAGNTPTEQETQGASFWQRLAGKG